MVDHMRSWARSEISSIDRRSHPEWPLGLWVVVVVVVVVEVVVPRRYFLKGGPAAATILVQGIVCHLRQMCGRAIHYIPASL
jgi:hypothetical protein